MANKKVGKGLKFTVLCLIALTQLFPLYWLLTYSLKSNAEIFGDNIVGLPRMWKWENYISAFTGTNLSRYFLK